MLTVHRYESLSAAASESSNLTIAVPSRLYFQRTQELPFAGLRISVKDVFHLKGVRTTAGNRAFFRLYAPRTSTSAAVQRAIDLGAIIVGKAKTAEFAGSQEVIGDWCDYSYSFNVRADGYMVSTGSSTGSASGLAAYPWLDLSIGSDGMFRSTRFLCRLRPFSWRKHPRPISRSRNLRVSAKP